MLLLQNNKIQNIMAKIKKNRKDKIIWMEKEMEKEKKKESLRIYQGFIFSISNIIKKILSK